MPTVSTYHDALKAIWNRSGYDRGFISNPFAGDTAARLGLLRTQALLNCVGLTALPYAIVHVAGSKGKGSTSSMIDAMLRAAGIRTGRYLSPHLHSFRERFVVDDTLISERDFVQLAHQFIDAAETIEDKQPDLGSITAFELNTAMALAWFAQQECRVSVIEVGMGGLLDSTNIVDPAVSVITTLDFEHTAILGTSMTEIAQNKAGIIKPFRPILSAGQPQEAMKVIVDRARTLEAPLLIAGQDWTTRVTDLDFTFERGEITLRNLRSSLVGRHQVENAGLAIAAVMSLGKSDASLTVSEGSIRHGLANTIVPARFEQTALPTGQTLVIDGAHTPASAAALANAVREHFPGKAVVTIIGMLADKNHSEVVEQLISMSSSLIAIAPTSPRALPVAELHASLLGLDAGAVSAASVGEAITLATSMDVDVIVVTGSLSTAAEARITLGLAEHVDPPIHA